VLRQIGCRPVLVDVGSSEGPPPIWRGIAPSSLYIAFDPDHAAPTDPRALFGQAVVVSEAITPDKLAASVPLYFTRAPGCSSVLAPDRASLSEFLFAGLFDVEKTGIVPATSLDSILARFSVDRIDWLKIDSQGIDLRIFLSVRDDIRSRILALDVEPGLIDAYAGEDLFVDAHRELVRQGFWLSNVTLGGSVRARRETVDAIGARHKDITAALLKRAVRETPAWVEARYLRTVDWLTREHLAAEDFGLLWVFAVLDGQLGFALDLAMSYARTFGDDALSRLLENAALGLIRRKARLSEAEARWSVVPRLVSRIAG
jgi:hypothetical protein